MNLYGLKQLVESARTVRRNTILIAEDIPEKQYRHSPRRICDPYLFTSSRPNYFYSQSEKFKITVAVRLCASGLGSADLSVGCHQIAGLTPNDPGAALL